MRAIVFIGILVWLSSFLLLQKRSAETDHILSYEVDPASHDIAFYYQDDQGKPYGNFEQLRSKLEQEGQELVFAMNGGMYKKDQSPQGLYIENGEVISPPDTMQNGYGNFYLQPNGIFYLTDEGSPHISPTLKFRHDEHIKYATQSGPMLVVDGKIHPKFIKGSTNLHIRNGVGILPNGNLLFAMSKEKVSFYDFADFFCQRGCQNALYLDGFVSRTYLPAQNWTQLDGTFGVIIAQTRQKQ